MECIFCKIIDKKIKADVVYEDKEIFAFRDSNPQAPVHILIIPRKHINSVMDLTSNTDENLIGKILICAKKLAEKEGISKTGFRIVINNGTDAGQAVDHLHLHLLGKRRLSWPPG